MDPDNLKELIGKPFPVGFEWIRKDGVLDVGYEDASYEYLFPGTKGMIAKFTEDYAVRSGDRETHFELGGLREIIEKVEVIRFEDGGVDIRIESKRKSVFVEIEDECN